MTTDKPILASTAKKVGMIRLVSILTILFLAVPAVAQDSRNSNFAEPYSSKCGDGTSNEIGECLADEEQKIDRKLNTTYQSLLDVLADPSQIKEAQRTWTRFRDASCAYRTSGLTQGSGMYAIEQNACLIDLSLKRIKDLEEYMEMTCNGCPQRKRK